MAARLKAEAVTEAEGAVVQRVQPCEAVARAGREAACIGETSYEKTAAGSDSPSS